MTATSATNDVFARLGIGGTRSTARQSSGQLGQQDFLKLMITQFRNQDPTQPMKNGEFLGQLAQFGTVSGIQNLESSFAALANSLQADQALRAASLVGRQVLVASDSASLSANGSLGGEIDVPEGGGHVKLTISDANGRQVRQIDLGMQPAGLVDFSWEGRAADGEAADPGAYSVSAELVTSEGAQALPTLMTGKVESVSLDQGTVQLAIGGLGDVALGDVREIGD